MKRTFFAAAAVAALSLSTAGAAAAYDIDADGYGFVGKGEVQTAFGWNNPTLQRNADGVSFEYEASVVSETTWVCTNSNNENTQERARTTTTSVSGVVESVSRERNQVTGFILEGFDGDTVVIGDPEIEGPAVNSCPSGPWVLTTPAGEPEVVSTDGGLFVLFDGARVLLPAPVVVEG
jgi:hypothetical protein